VRECVLQIARTNNENTVRYSIVNNYNYGSYTVEIYTHAHARVRECGLRGIRHFRIMWHMSVSYCSCSQPLILALAFSLNVCVCVCSVRA